MSKSRHRFAFTATAAHAEVGTLPMSDPIRALVGQTGDAFFRHIVSGMRNGVLAITRDARLVLINDEAYRIFGVDVRPGDVGQPVAAVLKDHPDVIRVLTSAFDLHVLPKRVEMRLKPTGRVIGYTIALVRDDAGAVIGAAMFFKDLTRVEQLEERERLRDRLAAVGEMAAVIAHEVKNPLAGIEVMAGLLRRKVPDSPEAQSVLTDIINEAKMANAIVQEVLDFVRPIRLQVEHTTVADAVQGAIQLADTKARRGNVNVIVNLPDGLPQIQADQHQLTQVFTNLLMNAYEAMAGTGTVRITASREWLDDGTDAGEAVLVQLTDDGPGIAPEVAEKVFDPFFTTKPQGSGLGLAIVRKIIDAHDGRIDLRTALGEGTTIRVTLPVTGGHED
jgi:signal transduction histidine kinase